MQNTDQYSSPVPSNSYRPAVPISVYRELAAELQAARAMLEVLNNQNQQLFQQNQQLRHEIDKVARATQNLQQFASAFPAVEAGQTPKLINPANSAEHRPGFLGQQIGPDGWILEQEEVRPRRSINTKKPEVNNFVLLLAIVLIVITAFGTSFLIVRPLFERNPGR